MSHSAEARLCHEGNVLVHCVGGRQTRPQQCCVLLAAALASAARLNSIRFKLATMTFKALHTGRPPYLTGQLQYCQPTRSLHSSGSQQLVKPRHNLSFGSRAFRISAPHIWNSLPTNIREAQSVLTFRRHLKTHYFQSAFSTP